MSSRNPSAKYQERLDTLKRRRDFLDKRIADYQGANDSRDKAEASALHWVIGVAEANWDSAVQLIVDELAAAGPNKKELTNDLN